MKGSVSPESTPERALVERVNEFIERLLSPTSPLTALTTDHWTITARALREYLQPAIAAFAAEYAREQVEQAIIRAPSTGQIDLHAMYNHARAEAAAARQREEEAKADLDFIRNNWSPFGARACPACVYDNGKFIRLCKVHEWAETENDRLTLAASESARTLQVEIEMLKERNGALLGRLNAAIAQMQDYVLVQGERNLWCERAASLKIQVTALREAQMNRPKIVCLCGSTRFFKTFQEANLRETVTGHIVLSIGCDMRSDHQLWAEPSERERIKKALDVLHCQKIDLADEVLVLNVDGYVGDSTKREIRHAIATGKPLRWWEEASAETILAALPQDAA